MMNKQPQMSCTYCDDIRREDTGKLLLIGCYGTEIIFDEFPAHLARLCIIMDVTIPLDHPGLYEDITLVFKLNGEPVTQAEVSRENLKGFGDPSPLYGIGEPIGGIISGQLQLPPLDIDKPSIITSHAIIGDCEVQGHRVRLVDKALYQEHLEVLQRS